MGIETPSVDPKEPNETGFRIIKNWYIKDTGDGRFYMSGMAIPRDKDGITRNMNFVTCDLHPASHGVFENCQINGHSIPDGQGCLYDYNNKLLRRESLFDGEQR